MAHTTNEALRKEKENSINSRYLLLTEYSKTYEAIYKPKITRIFSNTFYGITRIVTLLIALAMFIITVIALLSKEDLIIKQDNRISNIVFLLLSVLFFVISILFKMLRKRNVTIASLSRMLEKIIEMEKKAIEAEKQAYSNWLNDLDKNRSPEAENNLPEG